MLSSENGDSYRNIDYLWLNAVDLVLNYGQTIESRVGNVKEILGFRSELVNIESTFLLNERRKLSPTYACAEFLWYMSGTDNIKMLKAYAPQYENFAEDGIAFGAYGARMKQYDQINNLIRILYKSSNSRQAVITFWQGSDLAHAYCGDHKDIPCTLSLQFLVRDNKLHLITTMRSNDLWLGLPYDIFAFTCLQRLVADELGLEYGTYIHQVGSFHLYEKNWKAAEEALKFTNIDDRIQHDWTPSKAPWKSQIQTALCAEGRFRNSLNGIAEQNTLKNEMLHDVVSCCAKQFGYMNRIAYSPILQKGFENAKK